MIAVVLSMLLALAAGVLFLRWARIWLRADVLIGAAFLVGAVFIALGMLLLSLVGVLWSPASIVVATALIVSTGVLSGRARPALRPSAFEPRLPDLLTLLALCFHAIHVSARAPVDWDYWAIWGLKAKVFVAQWGIDWNFLADPTHGFAHTDYPPLLPLIYASFASFAGAWDDRWFGLLETVWILALLLVIRGFAADWSGREVHGAWSAALLAFPLMQPRIGIADTPLIAMTTAGLLVAQQAIRHSERPQLLLAGLLLGGGALTKNEGIVFLVIAAVAACAIFRSARETLPWLLPGLTVAAVWQLLRLGFDLESDIARSVINGESVPTADAGWLVELITSAPGVMWAALGALVVAAILARPSLRSMPLLLATPFAQMVIYIGVYAVSPHDRAWHVSTSWDRIAAHVAIPWLVAGVLALLQSAGRAESPVPPEADRP